MPQRRNLNRHIGIKLESFAPDRDANPHFSDEPDGGSPRKA
jgi:hypothetical protein